MSPLDDFIFALAPLGILTAVVSAIRVCGNSTLRALIGRAQEDPGASELEILSCVSDTTAEIFTESGVARITGNPKILEVVVGETQQGASPVSVQRLSEIADKTWTTLESSAKLPNLSLNKGVRRRAQFWFYLAAVFGVALQLGICTPLNGVFDSKADISQYRYHIVFGAHSYVLANKIFEKRKSC